MELMMNQGAQCRHGTASLQLATFVCGVQFPVAHVFLQHYYYHLRTKNKSWAKDRLGLPQLHAHGHVGSRLVSQPRDWHTRHRVRGPGGGGSILPKECGCWHRFVSLPGPAWITVSLPGNRADHWESFKRKAIYFMWFVNGKMDAVSKQFCCQIGLKTSIMGI